VGKLRWYKRDPHAALDGMMELTLEERGAYNTVLDLIYARDGAVADDMRFLAGWCRCDIRVWKRIRERLLSLGKLYLADGMLRNSRADAEVDKGLLRIASSEEAGRASARKRSGAINNNNDLASTAAERDLQPITTTTTKEKNSAALPREMVDQAFDRFWASYPRREGTSPKKPAKAKFEAFVRKGIDPEVIIAGAKRYADECARLRTEPRYVKMPTTWLNAEAWNDHAASAAQQQSSFREFLAL